MLEAMSREIEKATSVLDVNYPAVKLDPPLAILSR